MLLLLTLSTLAFAGAEAGHGAVRIAGGMGASELGAAGRVGLEGEVWVKPRLAVGARVGGGIDGLDQGRTVLVVEALMPVRALGGDQLSLVFVPGFGVADRFAYTTGVSVDPDGVDVESDTTPAGLATSASAAALVYGRMSVVSVSLGPRFETYGFQTAAVTLQLGLGLGW